MYSLLLALIYLAFISLGLPDSLLGSAWPAMHHSLDIPVSYMGAVSMVISGGTVISSLLSDRMTKRFGTGVVTVTSVFLTAAALLGFSFSGRFWHLVIFAVPYGLGAGAIDAALNNYVALHYASRHMSWLHCFWGVGTIVSPFIMSYALKSSVWNTGYRMVSFIQFGIALALLVTLPLWKAGRAQEKGAETESGAKGVLRIKGVPRILIGFFAYCSAESTAMYWASTYMVEVKGIPSRQAAGFAALFFIGITIGRFLSGFIANRLGDRRMILLGTVILSCGILLLPITAGMSVLSLAGFVILGLGCAPIYPCIIHSTPDNFGAENSGAIIGIQMAGAYVGMTFVPPLFGLIGNHVGFWIFPLYLALFIAVMICMTEATFRVTRRGKEK